MRILVFLLLIVSIQACKPVAMVFYGIMNPKVETQESLLKYSAKIKMDTSLIVSADTTVYLPIMKRIGASVPEAEIFDARGANLSYRNNAQDCNAGLFSFIPELKKDSAYRIKDDHTLAVQLNNLRDLKGNKIEIDSTDGPDFYLFLYWVRWMGKLNKDHVMVWEDLAKNNQNVKIKVIKVNLDFQDWWSDPYERKVLAVFGGNK